jgi:uncharacterized protein YjiS (DUF1127 family)
MAQIFRDFDYASMEFRRTGVIGPWLVDAWRFFLLKLSVRQERLDLARLSDDALADIGITREAAEREASREFDDVPKHRKAMMNL